MVEKITLFEPHFDGAQFGPASMEVPSPEGELTGPKGLSFGSSSEEDAGEEESKSRLVMFLQGLAVFVIMFVFLWIALSRLTGEE